MAVVGGLASQPLITQGLNHAQTSELGRLSKGRGGLTHGNGLIDQVNDRSNGITMALVHRIRANSLRNKHPTC